MTSVIRLYEADSRLGGTIGSDRVDGYVCDWGPNGFLDRVPLTLQLVEELGLKDKLRPANPQADNRFIYRHGRLHAISASPIKFMTSSLLSLRGRLRVTMEPFIRPKRDDTDESVFDFAARRIGREAAEAMIDPMVSGIFGGDAKAVSLRSCFPVMEEMERNYGSLFKAMLAKKKSGKNAGPAGPSGRLTSFDNGLYTIIERFHELYGDQIQKDSPVQRIIKTPHGYQVEFSGRTSETFLPLSWQLPPSLPHRFCMTPTRSFPTCSIKFLMLLLPSVALATAATNAPRNLTALVFWFRATKANVSSARSGPHRSFRIKLPPDRCCCAR